MIYLVRINNKEYEVEVERGIASLIKTIDVTQPESSHKASTVPQAAAPVTDKAAPVPALDSNANTIVAPMPGTILDIKAPSGKNVKRGEILLILEAMKMENEIVAPADGTVVQVFVTKGQTVSTGDALISIQ